MQSLRLEVQLTNRENDLSEVLQIEQVFTNVPKGQVAKKDDWVKAFKTEDMNKVIEEVGVASVVFHWGDLGYLSSPRLSVYI